MLQMNKIFIALLGYDDPLSANTLVRYQAQQIGSFRVAAEVDHSAPSNLVGKSYKLHLLAQ